MHSHLRVIAAIVVTFFIAACGGGGSTSAVPSGSTPKLVSDSANVTVALSNDPSTAQLPPSGGIGGTVTFPGISGTSSLTITSATTAPAGFALAESAVRRTQSGTLSIFYFMTLVPKTTINFASLPMLKLHLPASFPLANQQVYYAIQQPAPAGVAVAFRTEGPGIVRGSQAVFNASLTPLTLVAHQRYIFAFYALSANNVSADELLYVANAGANSISAYPLSAQGNAPPVRTISGPSTGLSQPVAVAVDPDGNLVVANALSNQTGSIEVFPDGANGDTKPSRTFAIATTPVLIAVDPVDASIYVTLSSPESSGTSIAVYSPTGSLLRSMYGFGGVYAAFFDSMAIDNGDEVLLDGAIEYSDHGVAATVIIPPHASGNVMSANVITNLGGPQGLAYASKTDHVFEQVFSFAIPTSYSNFDELQNGSFNVLYSSDASFYPLSADAAGRNVYGTDGSATIYHCQSDGMSGCIPQKPISGSNTGLAQIGGIAVGNP